jgi:hypothetical protein
MVGRMTPNSAAHWPGNPGSDQFSRSPAGNMNLVQHQETSPSPGFAINTIQVIFGLFALKIEHKCAYRY